MPTPADELRQAADEARFSPAIIRTSADGLHVALAQLLESAANLVTGYPELGADHDRSACDDYSCDLVAQALAVARQILGPTP